MKKTNPDAVWVAQAWQDNPRTSMIEHLEAGDLLVLDLHSECRPQWGGSGIRMVSQRGIWTTWVGVLYAFEFWW